MSDKPENPTAFADRTYDGAALLYDKEGSIFALDHEHEGRAYVRPMVLVIEREAGFDGTLHDETEDYEPAEYLVAVDRADLFEAPPIQVLDEEIVARQSRIGALKEDAARIVSKLKADRCAAERELEAAKRKLGDWMKSHRVMLDLGKLLDGEVLYPLSVEKNFYHKSPSVPRIPSMKGAQYLAISGGDFEKGQKWIVKRHGRDCHDAPFRFYDTEEERAAAIRTEFDEACDAFRKSPNFETARHTSSTTLHFGTLKSWIEAHPSLSMPSDIEELKAEHDKLAADERRAKLQAQLDEIDAEGGG